MSELWVTIIEVLVIGFVVLVVLCGAIRQIFEELRKKSERETNTALKILEQLPKVMIDVYSSLSQQQKEEQEKKELEALRRMRKKEFED